MPQARECPSVTIVSSRRPRRLRSLFRSSQPWTMPANSPWPREPEHIRLEPSAEPFFSLLSLLSSEDSVVHRRQTLGRSEEHTSELQSQSNLVCRLLLEKKKY